MIVTATGAPTETVSLHPLGLAAHTEIKWTILIYFELPARHTCPTSSQEAHSGWRDFLAYCEGLEFMQGRGWPLVRHELSLS